jgi:hypothetical protein
VGGADATTGRMRPVETVSAPPKGRGKSRWPREYRAQTTAERSRRYRERKKAGGRLPEDIEELAPLDDWERPFRRPGKEDPEVEALLAEAAALPGFD